MFIFAHIFAGSVFGLVFGKLLHDTRIIPVCIASSILSDLIDKPVGYILFPDVLGPSRTYFHALLAVIIITALALLAWRFRSSILIFMVAMSVLLHQLIDGMWHEPVTWLYPLLGPFQPYHDINYFNTYFWLEISSPSEWVFLFATLVVLSLVYADDIPLQASPWISSVRKPAGYAMLLLLVVLGSFSLWSGITGTGNLMTLYNTPQNNMIMGIEALTGFCILVVFLFVTSPGGRSEYDYRT
jgi:membrane-bound metal-dependent hydrolase YbcI (DUF457 family)